LVIGQRRQKRRLAVAGRGREQREGVGYQCRAQLVEQARAHDQVGAQLRRVELGLGQPVHKLILSFLVTGASSPGVCGTSRGDAQIWGCVGCETPHTPPNLGNSPPVPKEPLGDEIHNYQTAGVLTACSFPFL